MLVQIFLLLDKLTTKITITTNNAYNSALNFCKYAGGVIARKIEKDYSHKSSGEFLACI